MLAQVHGWLGYSRHKPFEHIYRHHRRYRITEGAEEIQMRRVAGTIWFYGSARTKGRQRGLALERIAQDLERALVNCSFKVIDDCTGLAKLERILWGASRNLPHHHRPPQECGHFGDAAGRWRRRGRNNSSASWAGRRG